MINKGNDVTRVKNDIDFSLISPKDGFDDGAFALLLPLSSLDNLPHEAVQAGEEVEILFEPNVTKEGLLHWVGADKCAYRVDLGRVDINAVTDGRPLNEVDIFCVAIDSTTGQTLGVGEIMLKEE